jgi:hypothetical protein
MRVIHLTLVAIFTLVLFTGTSRAAESVGWISEATGDAILVRASGGDPVDLRRFLDDP